jgi:hypothetical protein
MRDFYPLDVIVLTGTIFDETRFGAWHLRGIIALRAGEARAFILQYVRL